MTFHYKHKRTGVVAEMAEPKEVEEALTKKTVRGKPLDEGLVLIGTKRQKRILSAMDDSRKWERISAAEAGKATDDEQATATRKAAPAQKATTAKAGETDTATTGQTGGDGK